MSARTPPQDRADLAVVVLEFILVRPGLSLITTARSARMPAPDSTVTMITYVFHRPGTQNARDHECGILDVEVDLTHGARRMPRRPQHDEAIA
jgi:hypothetical protein